MVKKIKFQYFCLPLALLLFAAGCSWNGQSKISPELAEIKALYAKKLEEKDTALTQSQKTIEQLQAEIKQAKLARDKVENDMRVIQLDNERVKALLDQNNREITSLHNRLKDLSEQVLQYRNQAVWGERLTEKIASEIVSKTVQEIKALSASRPASQP